MSRNPLTAIKRWSRKLLFDPRAYWSKRHVEFGGSLRGIGHRSLSETENQQDYDAKIEQLSRALKEVFPNPSGVSLLDAGCGTGYLSRSYHALGFDVTGVDFAAAAVAEARKKDIGQFHVAPLDEMDLRQRYQVVLCVDVLFHVVDNNAWQRILKNFAKHLANDGTVLIQEHLTDQPSKDVHVKWRSEADYRKGLATAGLSVISHEVYVLPQEGGHKDILVCRHSAAGSGQ